LAADLHIQLSQLNARAAAYATQFVDVLLDAARRMGVSDVHLQPTGKRLDIRWRLDGVLQSVGQFPSGEAADIVSRLKVMAGLLTYRNDIPQEGRIGPVPGDVEMRLSTFPTLYGERAVVRFFSADGSFLYLEDLGLPAEILRCLLRLLAETSGAVFITGPAGSGKTTTVYACLRELARSSEGSKSIVTLEDPIEVAVAGIAQSQVNSVAGFDLARGLRSLLRQDPEVIMVGEIRDRETAEEAFQASLTGHLLLTTFHAGSAAEAISRLSDMGIEPYQLRSGILAILNQRLVRRLCQCARAAESVDACLGLPVQTAFESVGCESCHGTGYRGRIVLAEMLTLQPGPLQRAILSRGDAPRLEQLAKSAGMLTRWQRAHEAVEAGLTSPVEVRRVLGFSDAKAAEQPG
jgi:type II secretory ATPase GspE/PulE/Tfp pilus assembly ATPase PilB-like protein